MKQFGIVPKIIQFETTKEFVKEFKIGRRDLIFTSRSIYDKYLVDCTSGAAVIFCRNYGVGEPSDEMVEKINQDIKGIEYDRVFAIGGGTIIDVAKLIALKQFSPVLDIFDGKIEIKKCKKLIFVPTTCGTGSEVTNISILELKSRHTKMGLAVDALYGDYAVLVPELLSTLPMKFFATSSIDALIHAIESYTSPNADSFTQLFSKQAMKLILTGYQEIVQKGDEIRITRMGDFLTASTYAGIAFGNAGCAAVHAMSYPLGAAYHVPHGEANYAIFTQVYKTYQKLKPEGCIQELNEFLGEILGCDPSEVYDVIEKLLNKILPKKALYEYGMTIEDIEEFTETVMTKQSRLMKNNYVEFSREIVKKIYMELMD